MNAPATIDRPGDAPPVDPSRLRGFVTAFADLLAGCRDERAILESGSALLARLIARDDWLPDAFARHVLRHWDISRKWRNPGTKIGSTQYRRKYIYNTSQHITLVAAMFFIAAKRKQCSTLFQLASICCWRSILCLNPSQRSRFILALEYF